MKKNRPFVFRRRPENYMPFEPKAGALTSAGRRLKGKEFKRRAAELMRREEEEARKRRENIL